MNELLTERQKDYLKFIRDFIAAHSYPPSLEEIGSGLKVTPSGAKANLDALERKGAIKRTAGSSRSIEVLEG